MGARSDAATEPGGADWLEEPIALGATMGRYELRRVVGTGGMGVVFEALDPELARPVAVKVLRTPSGATDDDAAARLRRESRSMAQLTHPNVIRVYDVGVAHGHAFVAMELVVGTTLAGWLAAAARTPAEILGVFAQAGRGLAAAHAIGLVHRDFKPGNVMVADDGRVLVTDFGLARASRDDAEAAAAGAPEGVRVPVVASTITLPGQFVGTPAYMAPEQYAGGAIDARTDQFSFCVALWRALYGVAPFAGDAIDQLAAAAEAGWIEPPPAAVADRVSPAVRAAIERGLSGDPAKRFPAMTELLAALEPAAPVPSTRRHVLVGTAVAAVVAGGVGIWIATRAVAPIAAAGPVDAQVVVRAPPPDAAPPPPPPPPPDAAVAIDAAPPRRAPRRAPAPEPDPPDDFRDPTLVGKGLDPIMRKAARCGTWVDHEYSGTLQVDNQGVTSEVVVIGPDPAIVACMTRIAQQQRFPKTKFGGGGVSFEFMRP